MPASGRPPSSRGRLPAVSRVSRGARPADAGARATRARYDFSGVRVHADERAGATARDALHASAFTVGSHIVFAPGTYAPDTADGRRLLAHELAHVVQQGKAPSLEPQPIFRDAPDAAASPDPLDAEPQMTSSDSCNWPA